MSYSEDICAHPVHSLRSSLALRDNPLDRFERLATAEHYEFERVSDYELRIAMAGIWCDHDVSLVWKNEEERLDLFVMFDGRMPGGHSDDICRLLSLLNERLSSGHFDYWRKESTLVYRNSLNLSGGADVTLEQAMSMLASAMDAAERGYPACQYVVWAGKSPEEALDIALLELAAMA
jgi:hypothetical protein